ncbi:MAG: hypothetical protein ACRDXC_12445 [Acidimicrobiales bacterium]
MSCRNCGAELAAGSERCGTCGASAGEPVGSGDVEVAEAGVGTSVGASKTITFKFARLTRGDRIVGVAALIVFIALLLPWYGTGFSGFTVDGLWHGWMYLTLLIALASIAYLLAIAAVEVRLPVVHWQVLIAATGVMLLLVVIGLITTPSGATLEWGAIVDVVAAAAAFAGALLRRNEPENP